MAISSAGIGSGLDVKTIVEKLMAVEALPRTRLQEQQSAIQTKISAYGSLQSSLSSFRDAAQALTRATTWGATTATSADANSVSVSGSSSAAAGNYAVDVQQLAKAQSVASTAYASSSATVGEGELTIELGKYPPPPEPGFVARAAISALSIPISSSDSLTSMRDKINAAGAGVTASIITDSSGARLVLSGSSTGSDNAFRVSGTGGAAAFSFDLTDPSSPMKKTQEAQDAKATINGLDITSPSNILTDVVQGMTLTLQKPTGTYGKGDDADKFTSSGAIQVTASQDNTTMKAAIQSFVGAYNTLASTLKSQTKYDEATKKGATLQGDNTAVSLQRQLREVVSGSTSASSVFSNLSQAGIELQADGQLKVSETKLTSALSKLPELKKMFSASSSDKTQDGLAQRMRAFGDQVLGSDGALTTRVSGLNASIKLKDKQVEMLELREAQTQKRIQAQYSALDTKVAGLTALNTYITQQITNWNKSTG